MEKGGHICDEELVAQAVLGDQDAFAQLVGRYETKVYGLLWRLTGDIEASKDLFQDTWVKVHLALPKFRGEARFSTWLYTIALNQARSHHRKAKPTIAIHAVLTANDGKPLALEELLADPAPSALDRLLHRERRQRMAMVLDQLPSQYREVLVLAYQQGLSHDEIAKVLNKTVGQVKMLAFRGIRKARDLVKEA